MTQKGLFPLIPMMEGKNLTVTGPEDCGDGNFVTIFGETTKKEYDAYLDVLEKEGYEKFADNGEGLANAVYTATYTKDKWAVTVIHVVRMRKTYVSVCHDQPLSERLIYKNEYVKDNREGARTKLHMLEMWWFGNSFVLQLKNGHFIISDGGLTSDAPYLLDYLDIAMMTLVHHGFNTDDEFTDYCRVKTLLVTIQDSTPVSRANQNDYLKSKVDEYFSWGTGTKVLTFPYTIGSYETLPNKEWIYNNPADRSKQPNLYRYWRSHRKLEIRSIRINDNGMVKAGALLYDKIHKHLPLPITEDGMMMELRVDSSMDADKPYIITFEDPTGWVMKAVNEEALYQAINQFVETAEWSEKGFTAKLAE